VKTDTPSLSSDSLSSDSFSPATVNRPKILSKKSLSWLAPLTVTGIAALLRLPNLGNPPQIIFDETYYAKEALSIAKYGYEMQSIPEADTILKTYNGTLGELDIFTNEAAYVAHPPVGKWVIASGEYLFGPNPFGWRIAVAILGVLSVLILARALTRLTNSILIGSLGGFLLALDGIHIVMSRTALLDMVLSFFILSSFALLLIDKDYTRKRIKKLKKQVGRQKINLSKTGPNFGFRPYRILALITLGLAIGTKWSGVWFLVAFLILSLYWDWSLRRKLKVQQPLKGTLLKDLPIASLYTILIVPIIYIASWSGWIFGSQGWGRNWAETNNPVSPFVDWFNSLLYYHTEQLKFHTNLTEPHTYESSPLSWILQLRPTSFYYENPAGLCGAEICSSEVLALGNPIIWWSAAVAMIYLVWLAIQHKDWKAMAILVAMAAGWAPWFLFSDRPTFIFYTVVFVPFLVMALAYALGKVMNQALKNKALFLFLAFYLIIIVLASFWFLPIWNAEIMTYDQWYMRMWFQSWI
jgi:dolichyl-phosphate-mannose-protein mannosyltransferase